MGAARTHLIRTVTMITAGMLVLAASVISIENAYAQRVAASPPAGNSQAEIRIPSFFSAASNKQRRESIIEPTDAERSGEGDSIVRKRFDNHDCTSQDIAALAGATLIDYLLSHTVADCFYDFLFVFDQNLAQVFTDVNMQIVMLAAQERVTAYDGTNAVGLHQLWYFIHAGYFHEFYEDDVGPFNDDTRDQIIAASQEFELNSNIFALNEEAADILGEWLIILDNPGVREHFLDVIKQVLLNMTAERANSFTQRWAYNKVFFLMFRGIANNDEPYKDALAADGEMVSVLKQAALYEFLYPDYSYLVENAIGETTRLAEIEFLRAEVVTALADLLSAYPRLSTPYLKVVSGLTQYADCNDFGICGIGDEVTALVFPNRFVFDDGKMVVETPLTEGVVQVLYHAAKQSQSQFFRLIESISPVALDVNETITMRLYGSRDAYETYQGFLYDLPTDNGGIYIESGATFYTYQRTPRESIYSLEELFRHEYIHYLAGRFIINGSFGGTEFYQNCLLTWFDEGLAEFLAGSTQSDGVKVRRLIVDQVSGDGLDRMTADETIGSCYSSGFTFYRYSSMLFSYLYEEDRSELKAIVDLITASDLAGYNNALINMKSDAALEVAYQSFIDQQISSITELQDPSTDFPALVTLTTDLPSELESSFRDLSADSLAVCNVDATELNHRFGCQGEISGTTLDSQISGSSNYYFNEVLDSWIEGGNAFTAINNFQGMNCHFSEITDTPGAIEGDFATSYSCIGPLRNSSTALDSDQDGTPDTEDDFPFDNLGWQDANGNGILDPEEIPDADGDGMPDGYERAFGFNPEDPSDALEDADSDLVDNITEYQRGTDPLDANSTPATVDLRGFLRNDSFDPTVNVANSVIIYANLRFSGDLASNTQLHYSSSRQMRVERFELGGANCTLLAGDGSGGTLDCGTLTDGPSGLDIFLYMTPLQACQLEFSIEWTSDEVELDPDDNSLSLYFFVSGCPAAVPPVPDVTASDSTYSDRVELSWPTFSETAYYEIYRSAIDDSTGAALLDTTSVGIYHDSSLVTSEVFYYWVKACNDLGCSPFSMSDAGSLGAIGVSVDSDTVPNNFSLLPNYPNPFSSTTRIRFDVSEAALVVIKVYDTLGREVETIVDRQYSPGRYTFHFRARGLPSGVYLYRMTAGAFTRSDKMVLMR